MAGHFADDVNILGKLLIAAFNSAFARPGETPARRAAQRGRASAVVFAVEVAGWTASRGI
jgi:hypothetical protein